MGIGRRASVWLAAAVMALAACGSGGESPAGPTPTPPPIPTASSTATASPTASPASNPVTCEGFGSTDDQTSADPLAMSSLTGRELRVGRHDCYERFVFEMTGTGGVPGWSVGYRDPLIADPSGMTVDLAGDAALEVVVRVWTVTDYEGRPAEWPPLQSATTIVTSGYVALQEVRYISAFEGVTQLGIGVDRQRPFRAFWLDGPPRLVVDIDTGEPLG